jgi:hypothetical protein
MFHDLLTIMTLEEVCRILGLDFETIKNVTIQQ